MTPRITPAAAFLAALALPALAQEATREAVAGSLVLDNTGGTVFGLAAPLLTDTGGPPGLTRGLRIENTGHSGRVGIGAAFRCAADPDHAERRWVWFRDEMEPYGWGGRWEGPTKQLVAFHRENDTYTNGEPLARACTHWTGDSFNPYSGTFGIRVWGNWCVDGACGSLRDSRPPATANVHGYSATFRPGGPDCGGPAWPTAALRAAEGPAYAEWCEFIVDAKQ